MQSPDDVLHYILDGNQLFLHSDHNSGDVSSLRREKTTIEGQHPYAVIICCSDSRMSPEHIFMAGIGELFVIRNAGNVISDIELASIQFAVDILKAKLVMVLGHTNCGAINASLEDCTIGKFESITKHIKKSLTGNEDAKLAEIKNVIYGVETCMQDPILENATKNNDVKIVGAMYDTYTGKVTLL